MTRFQTKISTDKHEEETGITVYTDGSKNITHTGSGYTLRQDGKETVAVSNYLGEEASVFQAEIDAISQACTTISETTGPATIYCDSQAAIAALDNKFITSKMVLECKLRLNNLSQNRLITIEWVKAHVGHEGNERADHLAKSGTRLDQIGPLPFAPIPHANIRNGIRNATYQDWQKLWNRETTCRQTKLFMPIILAKESRLLVSQTRDTYSRAARYMTGHNFLGRHQALVQMGNDRGEEANCRRCGVEPESSWHVVATCDSFAWTRANHLNTFELEGPPKLANLIKFLSDPLIRDLEDDDEEDLE
jgi:ribonuclease HI